MNNEYKVKTSFDASTIIQESGFFGSDVIGSTARKAIDLQEQGVRDALIALGWTPPKYVKGGAIGDYHE